jgi:tetratricopeptide (TPR) repeat protein
MSALTLSAWPRLRRWCLSRDWRVLALGLPALLAGGAVLALVWLAASTPSGELRTRYRREGKAAAARKEYDRALTCFERLAPESADSPELLFQLALTAERVGQTDRAVGLMSELAPHTRQGYSPAHLWWARQLLLMAQQSDKSKAAAEIHLVRALDGELDDPTEAHGLLGQLYAERGRLDDAEFHLNKAVKVRPYLRLWLARLYAKRKDVARARQEAQLAVNFYRGRAKNELNNHEARLTWADALTFLEDFLDAVAVLEEGLSATRLPIYRTALARVYLAWYEDRKRADAKPGELFELLQKGLAHDPTDKDLLNRLLARLNTLGKEADDARAALEKQLASGRATAYTHFALSVHAFARDKQDEGRFHLERAHELDPQLAVVANNLAWSLAQQPQPDLPRALRLANLALEQEPKNAQFRDTRGHIYLKMGRQKEAVADLEAALARNPTSAPLHRALADAYEKLGNPRLAAEHRRLARQ